MPVSVSESADAHRAALSRYTPNTYIYIYIYIYIYTHIYIYIYTQYILVSLKYYSFY